MSYEKESLIGLSVAFLILFLLGWAVQPVFASSQPDFTITNLRLEPENPSAGQEVTPYLTIKNVGATREDDFLLNNSAHLEGSDSRKTVGGYQSANFSSGEEYELKMTEFTLEEPGEKKLIFKTDSLDEFEEGDESNNTYEVLVTVRESLPEPKNVIVEDVVSSLPSSEKGSIKINWDDPESIDKNKTKLLIYRSTTEGELGELVRETSYLDDIIAWHDSDLEFYQPYYYTLIYEADDGRVSKGEKQYKEVLRKPDFKIDNLNFPDQIEPGATGDLEITLANKGDGVVNMSSVGLEIEKGDELLEEKIVSGRRLVSDDYDDQSASADVNFVDSYTHTAPLTFGNLGEKEISVEVDPDNTVPELDEDNNTKKLETEVSLRSLELNSPSGGEDWERDTEQLISWDSNNVSEVELELLWPSGEDDYNEISIAKLDNNPGQYKWNIPEGLALRDYKIRITDRKNSEVTDMTEGYVTVTRKEQKKSINITSPKEGEEWKIGYQQKIRWEYENVGKVTIGLKKGKDYLKNLIWSLESHGSAAWTPDQSLEPGDNYRIVITEEQKGVSDESSKFRLVSTDQSEPDPKLLRLKSSHKVYEVIDGERHWIRNPEEFNKKGYRSSEVQTIPLSQLNEYPPLRLIRQKGKKKIYIVGEKNNKRHIPNPDTFYSYGFEPGEITEVEKATIEAIPETKLIRWQKGSKVYRIENGKKRLVSSIEAFNSRGYNWGRVANVNKTELESYPTGEPIN